MTETARLADQIQRAFDGEAWHGDSLMKLLKGVNAKKAAAKSIKNAHSIWELVLHITAWDRAVLRRACGRAARVTNKENFPQVKDTSEGAWQEAVEQMRQVHRDLVKAVAEFPDSRLGEQVPGKKQSYHNHFYMFAGIAQHEIYHAGQIAMLRK
jgi:uncharacterized damage-inducible protein DinB